MTLLNIAKACNGTLYNNDFDGVVSGVVIDSRLVMKNYLFIASKGEKVDGHDYIESAFRNGARAVVCEKAPMNTNNPYILVKDSLLALKEIARWYRMPSSA